MTTGTTNHHLLPCWAAMKPRTHEITAHAAPIGDGNSHPKRRSKLAMPSLVERVMPLILGCRCGWLAKNGVIGNFAELAEKPTLQELQSTGCCKCRWMPKEPLCEDGEDLSEPC